MLVSTEGDRLLLMDERSALSDLIADRAHLCHLLKDFTSGVVSATADDIADLRDELRMIDGRIASCTGGEPTFTWDDTVVVTELAATLGRPGAIASVVGISRQFERSGIYLAEFPIGNVYTVEFDDGVAVDVPQNMLRSI